ncbi:MAG TPA: efflux RND transporter periplasmic adaptor subunit [Chryseosolibacter sp.]
MKITPAIFALFSLLMISSCEKPAHHHSESGIYYTCPMHSAVRSEKPGACPVCGMALVKVETKNERKEDHSNMVMLDTLRQILAHISVDTIKPSAVTTQTTFVGKASTNKNLSAIVTARVNGRIDRLFIRQENERVVRGQPLYSIYSEELLADQIDYLSAIRQRTKFPKQQTTVNELIQGGKEKLRLWGMTKKQITALEENQQTSALLTQYSAYNGFVTKLLINEGQYAEIGKPLLEISNLSSVWIETQVYSNEIRYLNDWREISIKLDALPDAAYKGKIVFENPALEPNSKVNLVRFQVDNKNNLIKPGMMARVTIVYSKKETLVVPRQAVLIGRVKVVWVEVEPGMFERRIVETGIENKKVVEILSGLKGGERVVTSGAYLLNSELILKSGAAKSHIH